MGTRLLKIQMKQQLAFHSTNPDLEVDCNIKESRQLQHEWILDFPQVRPRGRRVIHKVENHDHQRPLMSWING